MEDLDVSCPAYDHFRKCVSDLCQLSDEKVTFQSLQIETKTLPQYFYYNRTQYLVRIFLWVTFSLSSSGQRRVKIK